MQTLTVREDFSRTIKARLLAKKYSKRWLYLELKMTPITFESRLKNNDWRLGEIIKITELLGLK